MRALEGNNVGDQAVRVVQAVIHIGADIGAVVPAEGFKRFGHEQVGIGLVEPTLAFRLFREVDGEHR